MNGDLSPFLMTRINDTKTALALGGVAVVGAGLSISSRFPVTRGLTSFLWDALDNDPHARLALATELEREDVPAKELIGDSWEDIDLAWARVAGSGIARGRFQKQFAELDEQRSAQPSAAHEGLARLIHAGIIECVVSLNWDTALEQAYERLYGTRLPRGVLFKPHGDAAQPEEPWTLPHEPGVVSSEVQEAISRLQVAHARTLLIVGYSESDSVVVDELVKPLDQSWRSIRIGPRASGREDLQATAEIVLPILAQDHVLREENASWHTVTYSGRRGVESWLAGERLGPQDVDACPEFEEVQIVLRSLLQDRAVVLNGPTGSGKSICAYQALRHLMNEGYEVLRLRDNARQKGTRAWLTDLVDFPHPKVLFIDDAQDLSSDTVREFAENATSDTLILIVGIDHVAGGVRTIRLSARSAVTRLAQFVRDERARLFPYIRALDDEVGFNSRDLGFEQRISVAEREETTWQFVYTLTGGWRRIRRQLLELRDYDRADLALAAIAVAQIAGVDSGVDRHQLETLQIVLNKDLQWFERALEELRARRLIAESDGRLRCAHLRAARNVITWSLHPSRHVYVPRRKPEVPPIASAPKAQLPTQKKKVNFQDKRLTLPGELPLSEIEADRKQISALFNSVLRSSSTPLRGCAWLVGRNLDSEARWILRYQGVLSGSLHRELAQRALTMSPADDIAEAAQLLTEVISFSDGTVIDTIRANIAELKRWYASIAPENGWALGDLVNSLHQPDPEFAAQVAGFVDARRLARLIPSGGWPHIYSSSNAVDRLCNIGSETLREAVRQQLDESVFKKMLDEESLNLGQISILIQHIASADHGMSLRLLEYSAGRIASLISDDLLRWSDLFGLMFKVLGYGAVAFNGRDNLPVVCRSAARKLVRALDPEKIACAFSGPQDQWEIVNIQVFIWLIETSSPPTFRAIANNIDYAKLEESMTQPPGRPTKTGLYLCMQLYEHRPDKVQAILAGLEPSLTALDPIIPMIAPNIAATALYRGIPLDLELEHHRWHLATTVVSSLAEYDTELALQVVESNRLGLLDALSNADDDAFEDLGAWIALCDNLQPALIDELLTELPEGAVSSWAAAIRRPVRYGHWHRDQIAPLVFRAAKVGGHVASEAEGLLRRFPALHKSGT